MHQCPCLILATGASSACHPSLISDHQNPGEPGPTSVVLAQDQAPRHSSPLRREYQVNPYAGRSPAPERVRNERLESGAHTLAVPCPGFCKSGDFSRFCLDRLPHFHTSTRPHLHTSTLPHFHISVLPHFHTSTLTHLHTYTLTHLHTYTLTHFHFHISILPHFHTYTFPHFHISTIPHFHTSTHFHTLPHLHTYTLPLPHFHISILPHFHTPTPSHFQSFNTSI